MGPHAHVEFERRLLHLAAAGINSPRDQDFPAWVLCSIPQNPDRTDALLRGGPCPLPLLADAVRRVEAAGADFAVLPCNTAHAYLPALRERARIPVFDMIEETLRVVAAGSRRGERIGLLATTGTVRARLYQARALQICPGIELLSTDDMPEGAAVQAEVMAAVYGNENCQGLKATGDEGPESTRFLRSAVMALHRCGVSAVIAGCTELSAPLERQVGSAMPVIDPLTIMATAALEIAAGRRPLPYPAPKDGGIDEPALASH
jgi:aspartate racemase